jgi:DNA gyrase inhibitor GyrI
MESVNVRIVILEAATVISFSGYGVQPEYEAWAKLQAYASPRNEMKEIGQTRRVFGFNNPNPSPGSPEYGYEFWYLLRPGEEAQSAENAKKFSGGRYAVLRCQVDGNPEVIPSGWKTLVTWQEEHGHSRGSHQWLEEMIEWKQMNRGRFTLDLYLPLAEE